MIYLLLLVIIIVISAYLTTVKPKNYPPGPKWFPIKGSVDALRKYIRECGGQHIALSKLAKEFNTNILGLKLGQDRVIVVFRYDIIKQILKSEDFESRPDNFFIRLRSMGTKKGITCADGELWSSQRNFLIRHFRNLGFGKEKMQTLIRAELDDILHNLESNGSPIEVGKLISPAVISVLWNLTVGARITKHDKRLQSVLNLLEKRSKVFDMAGGILNMYPWLRFLIPEKSGYNLMMKLNAEMKEFFMEVITEHYLHWSEGRDDDLIYAFITEMRGSGSNSYFTEDQLVMVCADILIAGAQTTSNTLDFVFLMMILHENVQKKVQQEIDKVFPGDIPIEYNSRVSVPYIEAVLMEVERYLHVAPIIGPRRVLKDTILEQYVIPKNTTVLISTYSVHMDEEFWGDPHIFRPERFLDDAGKLTVPERFIPFGLGRRRCPGESLAKSCLFIFYAEIMRKYTVSCPDNKTPPTGVPIYGINLFPEKYYATFCKRH